MSLVLIVDLNWILTEIIANILSRDNRYAMESSYDKNILQLATVSIFKQEKNKQFLTKHSDFLTNNLSFKNKVYIYN